MRQLNASNGSLTRLEHEEELTMHLARQVACPSVFLAQSQLREFLSTEAALEASTAANDRPQRSFRAREG